MASPTSGSVVATPPASALVHLEAGPQGGPEENAGEDAPALVGNEEPLPTPTTTAALSPVVARVAPVRIATWNVNSIRSRVDRVEAWLQRSDVDVLAIQETKAKEEQFPFDRFRDLGYRPQVERPCPRWS